MHSVYPVFHVFMLKPVISNSFSEKTQLASALVIIDRESKYKISWIVDSKIDCQQACKFLYKVIWLGYENTEDESEWILISKLTHATNLISNFHIVYAAKPGPLPLFWSCYYTCSLCYDAVEQWHFSFSFIYFSWFYIGLLLLLFFYWWWRGTWLQSHDMSHNMRS